MRAIVVDDEPIMLRAFFRQCRSIRDITIIGAFQSAEEVLGFLQTHELDIAFIDIVMPMMNGKELAEAIQKAYPRVQIVLVTAADDCDMRNRDGRRYTYILKPYKSQDIEKVLTVNRGNK